MIKTIYSINAKPFLGEDGRYHYLYKTTNKLNNMIYVGIHSTLNLNDNYLGSGKALTADINEYGQENFEKEILSFYNNRMEVAKAEFNVVNENFVNDPMTYNLTIGGEVQDRWKDNSYIEYISEMSRKTAKEQWANPEIREKMIKSINTEEARKKKSKGNKAAWQRKDYRENLSQKRKEMWQDPEIREKLMNNLFSEENRRHLGELASERFKGKSLSEEHRKKIGDANRGKEITPEQRERMSKAKKASTVGKIAILCLDENYNIIKKYNCMNDIYPDRGDGYRPVMKALRTCEPCKGVYYCREKDYEQFIAYKTGKSKEKPIIDINTKQSEKLKGQGCRPIYKIDQALNIVKEFDNVTKAMEDFPKSECTLHNYARNFTLCGDGFYYIKKKDYEKFIQSKQKETSSIEELF